MKINDLSLSDLKAAYDFVLLDIAEIEATAQKKNIPVATIPAYPELKDMESRLFDELLTRTRQLK